MNRGSIVRRAAFLLTPMISILPAVAIAGDEDECPNSYKALREAERIVLSYRRMNPPNLKSGHSRMVTAPNPLISECLTFKGRIQVINRREDVVIMAVPAKFDIDVFPTTEEKGRLANLEKLYESAKDNYHNYMKTTFADMTKEQKQRARPGAEGMRKNMLKAGQKVAEYRRRLRERVDHAAHTMEIRMGGVKLDTDIGHLEEVAVHVIDATWDNNAVVPALRIEAIHRDAKALPPVAVATQQSAPFADDVFAMCDQLLSDYPQPRPRETSIQAKRRRANAIDDVNGALLERRLTFEFLVEDITEAQSSDNPGQLPYILRAKPNSPVAHQLRDVRFRFGDYAGSLLEAARGDSVRFAGVVNRVEFSNPSGKQPLTYSIEGQVIELVDADDQNKSETGASVPVPNHPDITNGAGVAP